MDSAIDNIVRRLRESRDKSTYGSLDTKSLILMAQSGDRIATDIIIQKYDDFIKRMANHYHEDGINDYEDVNQLAYIGFWDAIMQYNPELSGSFEAFAGMIIKRKLIAELRTSATDRRKANLHTTSIDATMRGSDDEEFPTSDMTKSEYTGLVRDTSTSVEDEVIGKEGERELLKFMGEKFSETERKAVSLYIDGYKVSEIAEKLDMRYKSVENALMRVKNKLADYLRTRESIEMNESNDDIEFSDEEKDIISGILKKLGEGKFSVSESINEEYTEDQLDDILSDTEYEANDMRSVVASTPYDDREDVIEKLDSLENKLTQIEEYLSEDQYKESEKIRDIIRKIKNIDYEGTIKRRDPYDDIGMKRSDFQ